MRERARDKGRLEDIIEYSINVLMLMEGYTFEALVSDKRTYYSVMKNVEVVGEAAYMLTKAFKRVHSEIPWKVVQGMRHVLVHDYATIDDRELYNTAVNDIPVLLKQAKKFLEETDWEGWASAPDEVDDSDGGGLKKTARKLKSMNLMTIEQIAEATGLTTKEIEGL